MLLSCLEFLSGKVIDPVWFISSGFIYKGIGRGDKNNHPIL